MISVLTCDCNIFGVSISPDPMVDIRTCTIAVRCPSLLQFSWLSGPQRVIGGVSFLGQAAMASGGGRRVNWLVGDLSYGDDITADGREKGEGRWCFVVVC
jgi:hypothetical protein